VSTANDPWGRVDADGTVYVRTAGGERVVGSWQAGSPDEALAFFRRKFESLETEVTLLEQRISATDLSPGSARATIDRLLAAVSTANALGDLDSLHGRLEALTGQVDHRREEVRAAREHARSEAKDIKERIVAEAEQIASADLPPDQAAANVAYLRKMLARNNDTQKPKPVARAAAGTS